MKTSNQWFAVAMTAAVSALAAAPAVAQPPAANAMETQVEVNGVTIRYAVAGPADGEPVLLINGTGAQLIDWPPRLIEALVRDGYHVIAFDHRDSGLSTHLHSAGPPDWTAVFAALRSGTQAPLAYTLGEMAADAVALLDALSVERAHLLGVSMGGMIAQEIAAAHPERVRSLVTLGAGSGNPAIPLPADPARMAAVPPPPPEADLQGAALRQLALWRALAGPRFPVDEPTLLAYVRRSVARSWDPAGMERQGAAVVAAGDRRSRLVTIRACTVVLHGEADPLVPVAAAHDVARSIPGATLQTVPGLGHDLPDAVVPLLLDALAGCRTRSPGADAAR